jgi:hypothetical protein
MLREVSAAPAAGVRMHPRTRSNIERFGLSDLLDQSQRMALLPPQGYLEMVGLMDGCAARADRFRWPAGRDHRARRALPDDARKHRAPDHVEQGTNTMVGRDAPPSCGVDDILAAAASAAVCPNTGTAAAERIAADLYHGWRASPPPDLRTDMLAPPITNASPIDVEDYFQVSALAPYIPATNGTRASAASSATSTAS